MTTPLNGSKESESYEPASEEVIRKRGRTIAVTRFAIVIGAAVSTIIVVCGTVSAVLGYFQSKDNGKAVDILNDCLIPSNNPDSCYVRQQENQKSIIGEPQGPINTIHILSLACDDKIPVTDETAKARAQKITECVQEALK